MRYDDIDLDLLELALRDPTILREAQREAELLYLEHTVEITAARTQATLERYAALPAPKYESVVEEGVKLRLHGRETTPWLLWMMVVIAVVIGGSLLGGIALSTVPSSSSSEDTTQVVSGTWNVHCPKTVVNANAGTYSVIGHPTVTVSLIQKVLAYYHSPASDQAQTLYDASVRCGIDPAFTLAFFMHESSFGKSGEATQSLSPGNLRCIPNFRCQDGYSWYDSWKDGFTVYCRLIRNLYVDGWGLVTIYQIIPRYAPPSNNNDDSAYINALKNAVDTWRSGQLTV